jgi:non-ribosomal peptide synthase protein (TIGR01720 family)
LEDLWTAYEQLSRGELVALPPRPAAFRQWAERLAEYARSGTVQKEGTYWLAATGTHDARLPVDDRAGTETNTEASARRVTTALSADETRALLEEVPQAYNTQTEDVLLTALVEAFDRWTGERTLLLDLEGHGRAGVFDDMDLSRTAGCFTTLFPIRLDLSAAEQPGDALTTIKEQRRGVPRQGIGYGLLRYLGEDADVAAQLRALPQAEVRFSYLDRPVQALSGSAPFGPAPEPSGAGRSLRSRRSYLLEITARIAGDQLQLEWTYSEHFHRRATIEGLARDFMESLQALIAHCQSPEAGAFTASDFPEANLSQEDLDKFLSTIGRRSR